MVKKKRKMKGTGGIYAIAAALLMLIALAVGLSAFFSVSAIEVVGNSKYTADEIMEASGVELGGNLFLASESNIALNICKKLPYVSKVQIERDYPATLSIVVIETEAVGYIHFSGEKWLIDAAGKILEKTDGDVPAGIVEIIGMVPTDMQIGSVLEVKEDDALQLTYLQAVLQALQTEKMEVQSLNISNISSITLEYTERFHVILGQGENVDSKLELVKNVVSRLKNTDVGTIDASKLGEAKFIPN